jgi:hypothetical protein
LIYSLSSIKQTDGIFYSTSKLYQRERRINLIESSLKCNKGYYLTNGMSSDRRDNPEQIPSSYNEQQARAMENEQARIQGERKEVDVKDYPKAAALAQMLKDLEFPTDKRRIVNCVERARPQSEEILQDIRKIEDKQYENVSDVTKAAGLVRQ